MTKPNLTEKEQHIFNAIARRDGSMWSDELRYYVKPEANLDPSSFGGIVASLKKKGIVEVGVCDGREHIELLGEWWEE